MNGSLQARARAAVFNAVHTRNLVYVTCWEDPAVDRQALCIGPTDDVLTITSGGCNALDLLLTGARSVHAVDINPLQTALMEFRVAAIRSLDDSAVFDLFGIGRSTRTREMYLDAIRPHLTPEARKFWDVHLDYFGGRGWRSSFIYRGSAGVVHKLLRDYAYHVRDLGPALDGMLSAPDIDTQRAIYREHRVRDRFASGFMRWLLSRDTLLALLGIPASQRREIEQNPGGMVGYALDVLETAFTRTHLAHNYFWRGVMQGAYTRECCPEYLKPENLQRLRGGLLDRLTYRTASVTQYLRDSKPSLSRFVLLDHMDWLSNHDLGALADEWSAIFSSSRAGARAIYRSAATRVGYLDALPVNVRGAKRHLASLLTHDRARAAELHAQDRTCIYGSFHIANLDSSACN